MLAIVLVALVLGGCSKPGGNSEKAIQPPVSVTNSADISSGCWTAGQRAQSETLEGGKLVQQWKQPPAMEIDANKSYVATINTEKYGSFQITLFPKDAPIAVNNFVCLAKAGFYDNTTYHRIIPGFVVQGGDPDGTGRGGPGYRFNDEPITKDYLRGIVAMANAGANTNGSQYFVCLGDLRANLTKNYTIFGEVTTGMDVVDKIAAVPTKAGDAPVDPVKVTSVTIAES